MTDLPYEDPEDMGSFAAGQRIRMGVTQPPPGHVGYAGAPIPVVVTPRPFAAAVYIEQPAGRTVRAMLVEAVAGGHVDLEDLSRAELYVDGERIARDLALGHVLTEGQIVSLEVAAHGGGGGGGKDVGQVLLQIAVIAVSAWVGGGAGGAIGSALLARVAAAAIMVAGNMAINSIFAPDIKADKANDRYALQSASNDFRQWGAQPLALGEVVVAPDLAAKTFTKSEGDDVWIYGILGLHRGPCAVADIKIGDTLASSLGGDEIRMVEHLTPGPRTFSLYPNDVDQLDLQEELEATTSSATTVVHAASSEGETFEFDFYLPGGLNFTKDDGRVIIASVSVVVRYRAIDADGNPTGGWTSGLTVALSAATKDPWRVTRSLSLPLGRYEFDFTRSILEDDNAKRHTDIALTAIRAIAYRKPISDEVLSVIEFAVKATALNQGTLAAITCRITPICETWTGSGWGAPEPTSNPAALARWLLTGPAAARPLSSDQADTGLRAWAALCDEYDWSAHLYVTDDKRQSDVMALLEQAGRASLFWDGSQIVASAWVEKPAPRQLFAGPNLKDHRWTIDYPDPVHALRVEFENLDQDGEADEVFVYNDGYGETAGPGVEAATLIEALRLDGQKTQNRAFRDGRWALGQRKLQRRIDTWSADVEHVVCRYGDRVRLAWQRVGGEGGARVRCRRWSGGLVSGLRLDRPVTFQPGEDYVVDLRLSGELVTGVPVVNPAGADAVTVREIVFATPRSADLSPIRADLIAFGVAELVSEDVEIIGIEPGEGLTASLTGVRYVAPALMAGETGPIPDITSRLTRDRAKTPPAPVLLGVTWDDTGIRVGFSMPPWRGAPITGFTARWRTKPGVGETVGWTDLPDQGAGSMILITPPPRELPSDVDGVTRVELELKALTASGQASQALTVTAVQPVVTAPSSSDWTVTLRSASSDGSLLPALIVSGATSAVRVHSVTIEYATSSAGPWTPDYSGPATLPEYEIKGLVSGVEYWVAVTNLSPQGVPSGRRVYGPFVLPSLVAGDVSATSPTIAGLSDAIVAALDDITDIDADLAAARADLDAYGVEIAAARGGAPDLNSRIVGVNQARISGDEALAENITGLEARAGDSEADILDLDLALATETSARAQAIEQLHAEAKSLPNLIPNSEFSSSDWRDWDTVQTGWAQGYNHAWGSLAYNTANVGADLYLISKEIEVYGGNPYTLSFYGDGGSASATDTGTACYLSCLDASGAQIADGQCYARADVRDFGARRVATSTLPSDTVKVRVIVRKGVATDSLAVTRLMLNIGTVAMAWNDLATSAVVAARLTASETATADLELNKAEASDVVILSARTDDVEAGLIDADIAIATETSGRVAAIDALSLSIGDIDASISSLLSITGDLETGLSAVAGLSLDVNGNIIGYAFANGGDTGSFTLRADQFTFVDPDGDHELIPISYGADNLLRFQNVAIDGNLTIAGTITTPAIANRNITNSLTGFNGATINVNGTTFTYPQTLTFTSTGRALWISLNVEANLEHNAAGAADLLIALTRDGTPILQRTVRFVGGDYLYGPIHYEIEDTPSAGVHVYRIRLILSVTNANTTEILSSSLRISEAKTEA